MWKSYLAAVFSCFVVMSGHASEYTSKVWNPDLGNGFYKNPVINADYSDPDIICVDGVYYMTASSFCNVPGLPILRSVDLVNWEIVNHAVDVLEPVEFYNQPQHGNGIWAPAIRYHNGRYYIYWGDPDHGIYMVSADNPLDKWDSPVLVSEAKGMIDTCPLWDDDGKAYLVNGWAKSRAGINALLTLTEMSPDGTKLIGRPVVVYDGLPDCNYTIEGPKFYKKDGFYYIFAPAGGVEKGWQVVLKSKSPYGPYEARTVMAQGNSDINGPHQGGWVHTPENEDWFIHFQDKGTIGRVVHLQPMVWKDGWPVIGIDNDGDGCGEPVDKFKKPAYRGRVVAVNPVESDEFDSLTLGRQWQWMANYQLPFGFTTSQGFFRLYGHNVSEDFVNLLSVPNILAQKFPNDTFIATSKVAVSATQDGQKSGIIVFGRDYAYLAAEKSGDGFILKYTVCNGADKGKTESETEIAVLPPSRLVGEGKSTAYILDIYLRVVVEDGGMCRFGYSLDGENYTYENRLFKAREGHWIGAKIGFFSIQPPKVNRAWIDIDYFHVDPLAPVNAD